VLSRFAHFRGAQAALHLWKARIPLSLLDGVESGGTSGVPPFGGPMIGRGSPPALRRKNLTLPSPQLGRKRQAPRQRAKSGPRTRRRVHPASAELGRLRTTAPRQMTVRTQKDNFGVAGSIEPDDSPAMISQHLVCQHGIPRPLP
jgi:hypothetical protein